jgi:hypothetical protein
MSIDPNSLKLQVARIRIAVLSDAILEHRRLTADRIARRTELTADDIDARLWQVMDVREEAF